MRIVIHVRYRAFWFRVLRVPEPMKPWLRGWVWQSPCRGIGVKVFGKWFRLLSAPKFDGEPEEIDGPSRLHREGGK